MVSLNRRPQAAITSVVFACVVFQQGAGLINHRQSAGDAFRDDEAVITGGPLTFPQCLFSGLNQGRQQFSRDGHRRFSLTLLIISITAAEEIPDSVLWSSGMSSMRARRS